MMRVNRAVSPQMKAQKSGLLIQMGSIVGRLTLPFMGLYSASKFALEALTAAYRYELAAFGIDAVIIEPGTFPTTIASNRVVAADTERLALYALLQTTFVEGCSVENRSATPPDPQDVADAIAVLIAQPAGERPLNVVVAVASQREFPIEVNEVVTKVNTAYLEKLNILPHVTLTPTSQGEYLWISRSKAAEQRFIPIKQGMNGRKFGTGDLYHQNRSQENDKETLLEFPDGADNSEITRQKIVLIRAYDANDPSTWSTGIGMSLHSARCFL